MKQINAPGKVPAPWSAAKAANAKTPKIEPKAVEVLKQMCDYLKNLQQFSIQAEITEDVRLPSGQRIQSQFPGNHADKRYRSWGRRYLPPKNLSAC